jgi:hypothetical protein
MPPPSPGDATAKPLKKQHPAISRRLQIEQCRPRIAYNSPAISLPAAVRDPGRAR